MATLNSNYIAVVGLHGSGKTTYLAALWHTLTSGEIESELVLDQLDGDQTYVESVHAAWCRCEEVKRTSMLEETEIKIRVATRSAGWRATLAFPDMSGETFERQLESRACTEDYAQQFAGVDSVLFFVSADKQTDGIPIVDMNDMGEHDDVGPVLNVVPEEWSSRAVPLQVQAVELLQFFLRPPFVRKARRVAVLVSAWDLVRPIGIAPLDYLNREFPLLRQFLSSNLDSFEFQVFGISAQGGVVTGPDRDRLLRMTAASRISAVGPTPRTDLTSPLVWLAQNAAPGK